MASLLEAGLVVVGAAAVATVLAWVLTDDRLFRGLLLFATLGSAWLLVEATGLSLCNMNDPVGRNNEKQCSTAGVLHVQLLGIPVLLAIAVASKRYPRSGVLWYAAIAVFILAAFVPIALNRT